MLFFQWYGRAKYMLDVPLAPLVGAIVMTDRAWRAVDGSDRAAMLKAGAAAEARLMRDIPKQDEQSIAVMKRKGLAVTTGEGPEWNREAQRFADDMRSMVPDDLFTAALRERDGFRSRQASAAR
jgi:TRAP-type C4-dicarboxylate transport system substrate-binding protein